MLASLIQSLFPQWPALQMRNMKTFQLCKWFLHISSIICIHLMMSSFCSKSSMSSKAHIHDDPREPEVAAKYQRRADRFLALLESGYRVLFVYTLRPEGVVTTHTLSMFIMYFLLLSLTGTHCNFVVSKAHLTIILQWQYPLFCVMFTVWMPLERWLHVFGMPCQAEGIERPKALHECRSTLANASCQA